MSLSVIKNAENTLLLSERGNELGVTASWFQHESLESAGLIRKQMTGRGSVYFFEAPNNQQTDTLYALRHYCRGGAIAKLSYDRFIYLGLNKTRCFQELNMLNFLQQNNLNVPSPIAASIQKSGLFYTADLITEVIENATELHEVLLKTALSPQHWKAIGKEIKKMHDLGVCHYDINVKNILLQATKEDCKVFIIDFDKCSKNAGGNWQHQNIQRFKRSIEKQQSKHANYHINEKDWAEFVKGYQSSLS